MAGSADGPETPPPGRSRAEQIGEALGTAFTRAEQLFRTSLTRVEQVLADPGRRQTVLVGAGALLVVILLLIALPPLVRRVRAPAPAAPPVVQPAQPGQAAPTAAPEQPAPAPAPASGQPAPAPAPQQQLLIAALPLLLGVFWLFSAWLVDAEARRAFVVQEPWGERRTVAYTALAVGCVFPLILAGLIFSAWGFVTFVLDVARRQSPIVALQAAALILMAAAGLLVVRGLLARWLENRRAVRGSRY